MLSNCGVGEDSWESLGQQGDQMIKPVDHKGNQPWIFTGRTDAELKLQYFGHVMHRTDSLDKTLMLERLKAGREGDDRGWDGCMATPTRWTWVRVSFGSWWWTGKPGMLQSVESPRVGHGWATELNWLTTLWGYSATRENMNCIRIVWKQDSVWWWESQNSFTFFQDLLQNSFS